MTREEIIATLKPFLAQFIRDEKITPDQDLFSSGLVNSLFAMQMVLFIEKEYAIKVENEDLDFENFKSLNKLARFIGSKLGCR
jgi:methoxymalonate biosynthesis acyl carrier protein